MQVDVELIWSLSLFSLQMNDGGAVSPNLNGQGDRSGVLGGGPSGPSTADRDLMVFQQLTNLINAGYSEVS